MIKSHTCFISDVLFSQAGNNDMSILSSTQCIFEVNEGYTLDTYGPNSIISINNTYSTSSGAVVSGDSIYTDLTMTGDIIKSNTANAGIIKAWHLKNVYISDTKFINNTSKSPTIYISNSVENFTCMNCQFRQNVMEFEGILSISSADHVTLNQLHVTNNNVTIGTMIMIKKSINTTLLSSFFQDNLCSKLPCALSVQKSNNVEINHLFLINDIPTTNTVCQSDDDQGALDIAGGSIAFENVHFEGVPGHLYKGVSVNSLFLKDVSYECPESYIHRTEVTNTNPVSLQLSPYHLENDTTLALECIQCPEHYYRLAIPSLTLMEISDLYDQNTDGICYKCPSGGICDGRSVVAYPNYWGFVDEGRLKFVFCSEGFCCKLGVCITYNGCNEGREGDLCTSCKSGFQLSIVSNNCIPKEQCAEGWLYGIMAISGLAYVGFLVAKVEVMNILHQLYFITMKCKGQMKAWKNRKGTSKYISNVRPHVIGLDYQDPAEIYSQGTVSLENSELSQENNNVSEWRVPFDHIEIFHIIVFHLQDASLFQIRFPGMQKSAVQLEEFKERLISIVKLNSLTFWNQFTCFPSGWNQLNKILFESSIILVMICILLLSIMFIKVLTIQPNVNNKLMSSACRVFLLTFLFSSQRLCSYALTFISCEDLGPARYLFIDTTIECYQPWQILVFGYIGLFILPFWLVLLLGPGLLEYGDISVRSFLLGLMFPGPFVLYYIWLIYKAKRKPLIQSCHQQTSAAMLNEVWSSFNPFPSSNYLCWGGIVELRRLTLVFCATLISSHIDRLMCMIVVVILAFAVHVRYHPYSDRTANTCGNISLCAMIMVGMVNVWSAAIGNSGGNFDYSNQTGQAMFTIENILVDVFPVSVVVFCVGYFLYVNLSNKQT